MYIKVRNVIPIAPCEATSDGVDLEKTRTTDYRLARHSVFLMTGSLMPKK